MPVVGRVQTTTGSASAYVSPIDPYEDVPEIVKEFRRQFNHCAPHTHPTIVATLNINSDRLSTTTLVKTRDCATPLKKLDEALAFKKACIDGGMFLDTSPQEYMCFVKIPYGVAKKLCVIEGKIKTKTAADIADMMGRPV